MHQLWVPGADRSIPHEPKSATQDTRYPARGVLHTTETKGLPGYGPGWAPHLTIMPDGHKYQHNSVDRVSGALRNCWAGRDPQYDTGIDPDVTGLINLQIEVVGYARQAQWPIAQVKSIVEVMLWASQEWGITPNFGGIVFGDGDQYGYLNPNELTLQEWLSWRAWCGHQNVPENTHWDPGKALVAAIRGILPGMAKDIVPEQFEIGEQEGVDTQLKSDWDKALADGVITKYTDPDKQVTNEELITFLNRHYSKITAPRIAALQARVKALEDAPASSTASDLKGKTLTVNVEEVK